MKNAIEISNLNKSYSGFALDNVSLNLPSGSIMGFIGENGAGKSTTIKLILDLINRDSGSIKVFGKEIKDLDKSVKEHIGVVMDESYFVETMNANQVNHTMKYTYKTWNENKFFDILKKFDLPTERKFKEYSRGMKMKLAIAVALSHDSKLLILDEATSGLDPIVRDEILDVFLDFIQNENHSIFISSHITSDLEKVCDYISFIHKGKIMFTEEKDALLDKYAIVKCTSSDFENIDKSIVVGTRKNNFGIEALIERKNLPNGFVCDKATLEDIMLFYVKGEK